VLGILCMALASPWYSTWFVFVAVTSFITTLIVHRAVRIHGAVQRRIRIRSQRSSCPDKMSHSVTITRTTVATSGTSVYVNSGYLGTLPGLLKLAQLLLGAACVGVVGYYIDHRGYLQQQKAELFFLLTATAFLIGTFCLLTACLVSMSTASIISKTIYEVIYHACAFIFYLCAGLSLIIEVNHRNYRGEYEPYFAAS
ncbi:Uncharacterized protein OBRU01_04107, partial [Operophtera brumata]